MKRDVKRDPFFFDQPEKAFLRELRAPVHATPPAGFGERARRADEADASGIYVAEEYPDGKTLLAEAMADFERFLEVYGLAGERYPIRLRAGGADVAESWRLEVAGEGATVTAPDCEGVRRALIYIEDELRRREGGFLPLGTVERRPYMRTRITRCFFSPINRPPKYGDELSDGEDYYPEEYLNRLMHDGANAVWIYTRFSDLVESSFIEEYGEGRAARIAKLNGVCEKCARYGIKPYVFAIEPVALPEALSRRLEGADGGAAYDGKRLFCVNSPSGRAFVEEAGRRLFAECPGLGGFISITYGERPTSCSSAYSALPEIGLRQEMLCPRCRELSPGQALANAAAALAAGIHSAKPEAEVISWTYGHRLWPEEDIRDYVRRAPAEAALMQNFEEMGRAMQLGRERQGVDYWLSYAGPSSLFRATAEEARLCGKRMFMKTQVCCSHELATVPYIPVPGLLFDKYREARALGVEGVMQCWYFGNYPSLMSRAAGELAFMDDFTDKRGFLERLAGLYWGESNAAIIADAWERFEAGYRNYPLNIMFSYYGPMHDGPVWELALKPKNFSLPRSWQTLDPADGDRIGECLLEGHTLDECRALCRQMADEWRAGLERMRLARARDGECAEQLRVAEALDILLHSGLNILNFYALRERLGLGEASADEALPAMRAIVLGEIASSRALCALCEADGRLGYHSEGEGYKYFPKKLCRRIESLERLLAEEFPEVEARASRGQAPLAYYAGEELDSKAYRLRRGDIAGALWEPIGESAAFRAAYDDENLIIEWRLGAAASVRVDAEFRLMWPAPPVVLRADGEAYIPAETYLYYSVFGERLEALRALWKTRTLESGGQTVLRATLERARCGWTHNAPLKMRFAVGEALWCAEDEPVRTLGKPGASPGEFGWLLPEGGQGAD